MKHLIPGWVHRPGAHCASTAISDVMTFRGHPFTEAFCFGLGAGLGFAYFESPLANPTRLTAVRSRMLESRFFEHIGWPFSWHTDRDPQHALETAKESLQHDAPLLIHADIAHLPYYNTTTHFPGHVIALWGFDDEQETVLAADTGWPELLPVPYAKLNQARYDGTPVMKSTGDYYSVPQGLPVAELTAAVRQALRQQARDLFGLKIDLPGVFGFEGMKRAAAGLPGWTEAPDWKWCARWLYQVIEKRGTGGGAFRLLYSHFLEEIRGLDPKLSELAPAEDMQKIAAAWTELALRLKELSEGEAPTGLAEAAGMLASILAREEKFFGRVIDKL